MSIGLHAYADPRFDDDDFETRIDAVNEGKLEFISEKPVAAILHSKNDITITEQSLETGWLKINQCYRNLDAIHKVEIVYNYRNMKNLRIESSKNIGHASIVKNTVQLEDVNKNASLCVTAEAQSFYKNPDGSYTLVKGPYHRRFLDGYYPYHVSLSIHYPHKLLSLSSTEPVAQSGFSVIDTNKTINIDTLFEGVLDIKINFVALD